MFDWKSRLRSKPFWVALFAFIALTGQTFGFYAVPQGWDVWVNAVLALMIAAGIIVNPTTPGVGD